MKKCYYCDGRGLVKEFWGNQENENMVMICPICKGKKEIRYTKKVYQDIRERELEVEKYVRDRPDNKEEIYNVFKEKKEREEMEESNKICEEYEKIEKYYS